MPLRGDVSNSFIFSSTHIWKKHPMMVFEDNQLTCTPDLVQFYSCWPNNSMAVSKCNCRIWFVLQFYTNESTTVMDYSTPLCHSIACTQIWWFECIAEMHEYRFLSKTAAAILPAQQPRTQSAWAMRSRYGVLGFIYYGVNQDIENLRKVLQWCAIEMRHLLRKTFPLS